METSMSTQPAARPLSAARWVEAAIEVLVERGVDAVAVEPLAARLGATKGSFYHHFENREALILAALEEWEHSETEAVIQSLEAIPDPAERIRAVAAAAHADREGGLRDAALLASSGHPLVRPVVARVTTRRLAYLTDRYVEIGLSRAKARRRALLLYCSYLGLFSYLRAVDEPRLGSSEVAAYTEELLGTLVPHES
jgi:AcrR family transcriptional regulator